MVLHLKNESGFSFAPPPFAVLASLIKNAPQLLEMQKVDAGILFRISCRYRELDTSGEGALDVGVEVPSAEQVQELLRQLAHIQDGGMGGNELPAEAALDAVQAASVPLNDKKKHADSRAKVHEIDHHRRTEPQQLMMKLWGVMKNDLDAVRREMPLMEAEDAASRLAFGKSNVGVGECIAAPTRPPDGSALSPRQSSDGVKGGGWFSNKRGKNGEGAKTASRNVSTSLDREDSVQPGLSSRPSFNRELSGLSPPPSTTASAVGSKF